MKALTLWPPYAAAIAAGIKRIETRLRPIRYRGPLAIHAGVKDSLTLRGWFEQMLATHPDDADAFARIGIRSYDDLPKGQIVATCDVFDCMHCAVCISLNKVSAQEKRWGDYKRWDDCAGTHYRWGWRLDNIQRLPDGPLCRGKQGLWDIDL